MAGQWTLGEAAGAFISSLWSAPIIWRSLLAGKLIAEAMPEHDYTPYPNSDTCRICGLNAASGTDTTRQWYWRMTSGTPLDGDPFGYVLAFRELASIREAPTPNDYDRYTFRALLTAIRSLPPQMRYSKAAPALKKIGLLPTGKEYGYRDLLENMGLIGLLDTEEYPGMSTAFTSYQKRDERPSIRVEIQAPLAWWDSSIGLNEATLSRLFNGFELSDVSIAEKPIPEPAAKETVAGAFEHKKAPRAKAPKASPHAGTGAAQGGDVYAVRIREGLWLTVYCHEIKDNRVKVEYLDGIFEEMPGKEQLIMSFRPRKDGRWQSWAASMDSASWVRRVARDIQCPASSMPEPDRIPYDNAKNLKFMADWCFPEI
ncbi:hypothetical protein ACX93W_14890 [Paenibacillus sp. CAU 1782]